MNALYTSFKFIKVIFYVSLIYNNLFGYIDPGSGSMILQILLAGFFASIFYIKTIFYKVKNFFEKLFK